jgi:hypothetical protein
MLANDKAMWVRRTFKTLCCNLHTAKISSIQSLSGTLIHLPTTRTKSEIFNAFKYTGTQEAGRHLHSMTKLRVSQRHLRKAKYLQEGLLLLYIHRTWPCTTRIQCLLYLLKHSDTILSEKTSSLILSVGFCHHCCTDLIAVSHIVTSAIQYEKVVSICCCNP